MKQSSYLCRGVLAYAVLVLTLFCGSGCDYFSLSNSSSDEMQPNTSGGTSEAASVADTGSDQTADSASAEAASASAPAPAPVPETEFAWIPGSDSVVVKIPAKYAHWKFFVCTRRRHVNLYGPDFRGGNKAQEIVYTLEGGGAAWQKKSRDAGDDGTLLVFINTKDAPAGSEYRNTAWRIMKPTQAQYGDGDRLKPGDGDR